jgi:hypothetical protein
MTTYTIAELKSEWEAALHGTTLDKIANPYDIIYRAARDLMADCDLMESKRTVEITNAIYTNVNDYQLPSDVKLDAIIDLRPQANRSPQDSFVLNTAKQFDKYKALGTASVDYNYGLKHLRLQGYSKGSILFNDFNGPNSNGVWTGDNAVILTAGLLQNQVYAIPPAGGSLQFNMSGAGTGTLTNSTISALNFSNTAKVYPNWPFVASLFVWLYIPLGANPANLTSIYARWGSSAGNYYQNSTATNFWGQGFVNGWNLLKFDWSTATTTGTPNLASVNYAQIGLTWTGGATNAFFIDSLQFKLPNIYELVYYSSLLFSDSSGNWKNKPTDDTDTVNLEDAAINLLLYKILELSGMQIQQAIPLRGKLINFDMESYGGSYDAAVQRYKTNYPSERLKKINSYYRKRRYGRSSDNFLSQW